MKMTGKCHICGAKLPVGFVCAECHRDHAVEELEDWLLDGGD